MAEEPETITGEEEKPQPKGKRSASKPWLDLLLRSDKAGFDVYNDRSDKIDKAFADADRLSKSTKDSEFQIFWANIQVLAPSIYSRPPVPVVTTRFQNREPIPTTASELLERSCIVAFEMTDLDYTMRLVRDDLAILARGVLWVRYEAEEKGADQLGQKVCIEHLNRKDFKHDAARVWNEVDWVGRCAWLTRVEMRKRFAKISGDAYKDAKFAVRKDEKDDGRKKAAVWEIWSKSQKRVVWVSEGVEVTLDEDEPHLTLENFFPCPRPAYGTLQRNTLLPVPDYSYYQDQIAEINDLTNRIASLSDSLRLRGFYPAGAGDIGTALQTALRSQDDRQVLVPIQNWALIGKGNTQDMIVWLPLDVVASALSQIVTLRRQLIDDVYQISGLSDIMRGSTDPKETLGAQQLKSQYGSVRIRDRQEEMVRVARDVTRIVSEIMAENFRGEVLLDMAQMTLATDAEIEAEVGQLEQQKAVIQQQAQAAQANPQLAQAAAQNPEQAQQIIQQVQQQAQSIDQQIQQLGGAVTIDKVMKFLRDQRIRPFALDIETDSTIAPDENANKQRATEYVTAISGLLGQAERVKSMPEVAPIFADTLKYVNAQFRAGREVQSTVDQFADRMKQLASQPQQQGPSPEQQKAEADAKLRENQLQIENTKAQATIAKAQGDSQAAQAKSQAEIIRLQTEAAAKAQEHQANLAKMQQEALIRQQEHDQKMQEGALELEKLRLQIIGIEQKNAAQTVAVDMGGSAL